jgi:hypothetical protein
MHIAADLRTAPIQSEGLIDWIFRSAGCGVEFREEGFDRCYFETSGRPPGRRFAVISWAIRRNDEMMIPDSASRFAR